MKIEKTEKVKRDSGSIEFPSEGLPYEKHTNEHHKKYSCYFQIHTLGKSENMIAIGALMRK